jgi:hypothetical protein
VPAPLLRVMQGVTVEVTLKNATDSAMRFFDVAPIAAGHDPRRGGPGWLQPLHVPLGGELRCAGAPVARAPMDVCWG